MNRLKYLSVVLFAVLAAVVVIVACSKDKTDTEAEGRKAGMEMCGCATGVKQPVLPNHPASPLPPEGFNPQNPDLTDPATLAYLSDPAIIAYFAAVKEAYDKYQTDLFTCVFGVAGRYEKYFAFVYNPETFDGNIFSAFDFKDEGFQKGFLEEAQKCANIFGL